MPVCYPIQGTSSTIRKAAVDNINKSPKTIITNNPITVKLTLTNTCVGDNLTH